MLRLIAVLLALALQTAGAAAAAPSADRVGDLYEVTVRTETKTTSDIGSSGSSTSGGQLVERVVGVRDDGLELQFDLPNSATAEDRARDWQFPVRVAKPLEGPLRLLNQPELETRIDAWLKLGGLPREQCGRWYFTWTAFKVECDSQTVLSTLTAFDLREANLRDGAAYRIEGGLGPASLRQERSGKAGAVFVAEFAVDPEAVRRERAESDIMLAQVMGKPAVTIDEALKGRAVDRISGKITIRIETDASGRVTRRIRIASVEIVSSKGLETSRTTQTAERRAISAPE